MAAQGAPAQPGSLLLSDLWRADWERESRQPQSPMPWGLEGSLQCDLYGFIVIGTAKLRGSIPSQRRQHSPSRGHPAPRTAFPLRTIQRCYTRNSAVSGAVWAEAVMPALVLPPVPEVSLHRDLSSPSNPGHSRCRAGSHRVPQHPPLHRDSGLSAECLRDPSGALEIVTGCISWTNSAPRLFNPLLWIKKRTRLEPERRVAKGPGKFPLSKTRG